jgi:hypothetical protein
MGGDILYDVPDGPMRPTEQGMVYRGRVAHSRPPPLQLPAREAAAAPTLDRPLSVPPTVPDSTDGGIPPDATDTVGHGAPPATWGTP